LQANCVQNDVRASESAVGCFSLTSCNRIDSIPLLTPEFDKSCPMKSYRLSRLFNAKSNRCFDVAIDHGFFNEYGFLAGIENLANAVSTLVAAAPDAIQLTVGQARLLQSLPGRHKPSLVLRTDVANVYGKELPRALFSRMIENPVEQALRLDATCVVVNLFRIPNEPEVSDQCIQNILKIKPECDRYSMPLMIEPLVFQTMRLRVATWWMGIRSKFFLSFGRRSSWGRTSSKPIQPTT